MFTILRFAIFTAKIIDVKNLLPFLSLCLLFACKKNEVTPDNSVSDQLTKEVLAIDQTLQGNTTDFILYQSNGLRLAVHSFGSGPKPLQSQAVVFGDTSRLFPSRVLLDTLPYNGFLYNLSPPGLKAALQLLPEGSKATIYVPSAYAYGINGSGKVPANTTVTYKVNLKKVTRSADDQTQWKADTAAINKHIKGKGLKTAYDSSGVFYTVDSLGTGDFASPANKVTCGYTCTSLDGLNTFDAGQLTDYPLLQTVDGFRIGVCKMKIGNTATIYIPSGLGYGPLGSTKVPANAILVFKITALSSLKK